MGGKCCTDRKEATNSKVGKPDRKSVTAGSAYDGKKRAISIGYHAKGDDAEKFDKAFENNDLKAFVSLLSSTQTIESFEERMHPWAEDPRTVGALAGTQLAIMASMGDNPSIKEDIRRAGGILPLVDFLKSNETDRVQTAVVALSFLTAECKPNSVAAFEAGVMPLLMKHLDSEVAGMRAASATTLRNICIDSDEYRRKFVDLGGIKGLVKQLNAAADPSLNQADVHLEAVLNLEDVIEDEDGSIIEAYAKQAIAAGAEEKLRQLTKSDDEEVRGAAEEVLEALKRVKG